MGKLGNTLTMLRFLETGQKMTVKELAEKLEVTPRMIKIYKEELEKSGIYIDSIKGQYGGYVYKKQHNYNISFNYLDVDAIESVLDKLSPIERNNITLTLEKIRSIVIYSTDESRYKSFDKEDLQKKYQFILKAIKNSNILSFKFHNKNREFIPYTFTFYKDFIYITGYSILEDDIKTLNLNGIKDLDLLTK